MLSEEKLKAIATALLAHRNANKQYENWPPENKRPFEEAASLIQSFQNGDVIASLWWVEDVQSLIDEDDEADGEKPVTVAEARKVLEAADDNHDATIGINWDVLHYHLDNLRTEEAQ